jgi:hypothetical protein
MKMTRGQAIGFHAALSVIAQGQKGVAPDIAPKTFILIATMLNCLAPVRDSYDKTSAARFQIAVGDKPARGPEGQPQIADPAKALQYNKEVRDLLDDTVNVRMPKEKILEADLKIKDNDIPAGLIAQIIPLIKFATEVELDEDE